MLEPIAEITAIELAKHLEDQDSVQIIDVREPHELSIGKIPGTKAVPLGVFDAKVNWIEKKKIVFVCKSGARSLMAIRSLRGSGYNHPQLFSLAGGILAWAEI